MVDNLKTYLSKLSRRQTENEQGAEIVEFIIVFPILIFTIFAGIDFGWVFYQKISFEYALAAVSWNIDPSSISHSDEAQYQNLEIVRNQILNNCPDIIADNLQVTASTGEIDETTGLGGTLPVLEVKAYESSAPLTSIETEKLGLKSRKYVHTYVHVQAHYKYEIDWIIDFGTVFNFDDIEGDINELRTCGKDFYFSPEAAENA